MQQSFVCLFTIGFSFFFYLRCVTATMKYKILSVFVGCCVSDGFKEFWIITSGHLKAETDAGIYTNNTIFDNNYLTNFTVFFVGLIMNN